MESFIKEIEMHNFFEKSLDYKAKCDTFVSVPLNIYICINIHSIKVYKSQKCCSIFIFDTNFSKKNKSFRFDVNSKFCTEKKC
jgi:hypothetical protein